MKKLKLISKKQLTNNKEKIYDIEVADEHNYILENNIISHNSIGSFFGGKTISGGGGILYNSSMIFMLTKSKLTDKDSEEHVKRQGLDEHTKIGIVVTVNPVKQRFARPIKVQVHIPFYKKPNPYVGLEKFVSWKHCGILRGKCLTEKDFEKLTEKEQDTSYKFEIEEILNVTSTVAYNKLTLEEKETIYEIENEETKKLEKFIKKLAFRYAFPKDTARSLVCRHLGGEIPLSELYTDKVFTHSVLTELDENIIKPTFQLPSIELLEDLADVTADLENFELDDTELGEE